MPPDRMIYPIDVQLKGPAHGRPMQLQLAGEGEMARQPQSGGVAGGSKRVVQRTSSFYPGRNYVFGPEPSFDPSPRDYDAYPTTEEDSNNEEDIAVLTQGQPGKIREMMATERPSWPDSATSARHPTSMSRTVSTETVSSHDDTSPQNNGTRPMMPPALESETSVAVVPPRLRRDQEQGTTESPSPAWPTESPLPAWPADTDLCFAPGGTRVMLTLQRPLIRTVIQDAIEDLRASLTFNNAFPDSIVAISFIQHSLNSAAEKHCPAASSILRRLSHDERYVSKITPVLRARISLIRSDVKERCNSIILGEFLSMPLLDIVRSVEWQCSGYHYMYPKASKGVGSSTLVMGSKPYRNNRIILAIRNLYFTGGGTSFAVQFDHLFPISPGDDEATAREVPISMVALVATALYASIIEWRTGSQQVTEFSANTYFDVYQGHINTLRLIRDKRGNAFHRMMADIYSQASSSAAGDGASGAPIAQLDLECLE